MYYGVINYDMLWNWMNNQQGKYVLSFNGKTSSEDMTQDIPLDIYTKHIYINSGNSSFRRVIGKSKNTYVKESLYIK